MGDDKQKQDKQNTTQQVTDTAMRGIDELTNDKVQDFIKENGKKAASSIGQKAGEAGAQAAEEAMKSAAKAVAAEAVEDSAGAATAGVGKAVMMVGRITLGFFDSDGHDAGKGFVNLVVAIGLIFTLIFLFIPTIFMGYIEGLANSASGKARSEKSYDMLTTGEAKRDGLEYIRQTVFSNDYIDVIKKWFNAIRDPIFGDLDPYTQDNAMLDACQRTVKFLEDVFKRAKQQSWLDTVKWMILHGLNHDGWRATSISYDQNGNPYTYEIDGVEYNNVNYAELIAVINQNEEYNEENITTKKLKDLFKGANALRHLFRLKIEEKTNTKQELLDDYGIDIIDEIRDPLTGQVIGDDRDKVVKWGYVTLRKYYLIDLYKLVNINAFEKHYRNAYDMNIEMLDKQEPIIRRLSDLIGYEEDENLIGLYGPYERSEWDGEPQSTYIDDTEEVIPNLSFADMMNGDIPIDRLLEILTDEEVVLPMLRYLNQGSSLFFDITRGDGSTTVKSSACADMSWLMIAEYFTGYTFDIKQIESKYVKGDLFQTSTFLADYGLSSSGRNALNVEAMRSILQGGTPIVMHVAGQTSYHHTNNGHFMVVMGYNENGFYVYDPGSSANTYTQGASGKYISYQELMSDAAGNSNFYYQAPTYNGKVQRVMAQTTTDEVTVLAQLLYAEAGNQGTTGMKAVGEVVRNRVNSPSYPNTYRSVIMQSGQFSSVNNLANHTPTEEELAIAREVINGSTNVLGSDDVYMYKNTALTSDPNDDNDAEGSTWYGNPYYEQIGDHTFYGT